MTRALAIVALIAFALFAINGHTPLEIIGVALIVLIVGGAALVVVKLVQALMPKP